MRRRSTEENREGGRGRSYFLEHSVSFIFHMLQYKYTNIQTCDRTDRM